MTERWFRRNRMRMMASGSALVAGAVAAPSAEAANFPVSNLNDAGAGSLRDAIDQANLAAGADDVTFQAGLSGTITLTTGQINIDDGAHHQRAGSDAAGRVGERQLPRLLRRSGRGEPGQRRHDLRLDAHRWGCGGRRRSGQRFRRPDPARRGHHRQHLRWVLRRSRRRGRDRGAAHRHRLDDLGQHRRAAESRATESEGGSRASTPRTSRW